MCSSCDMCKHCQQCVVLHVLAFHMTSVKIGNNVFFPAGCLRHALSVKLPGVFSSVCQRNVGKVHNSAVSA